MAKAFGLIEVLIVLGIVGTTVIGISQLAVASLLDIRDDELGEYAAGVMVQGLEITKSANSIEIDQHPTPANPIGSYSLAVKNSGGGYALKFQGASTNLIQTCNASSAYFVSPDAQIVGVTPTICAQIIIKTNSALSQTGFEIVSNVVYIARNTVFTRTAKSYRYAGASSNFILIGPNSTHAL